PPMKTSADIKITLGPGPNSNDPWGNFASFYTRRPRSRLGLYSVIQEAMRNVENLESPLVILAEVKSGKIPLRICANLKRDIRSALELSRSWAVPVLLEGGTECYHYFPEMKTQQFALLYAPILNPPSFRLETDWGEEQQTPHLFLPQLCVQAGIPLAITSSGDISLSEASKICLRYGLAEGEVLNVITLQPAKILGIADQVGSLEPGKFADILIFNGHPFQFTGKLETVFIQGTLVYQKK
ncbi:MAG: amidohydrolase family protein, partial [Planctomycetota bacterium]